MSHQRPGDTIPLQQETEAIIDKRLAAGGGDILTTGLPYVPDQLFDMSDPPAGVAFGAGFSSGAGDLAVARWGRLLTFKNPIRFDADDLNNYGFYNEPLITLPDAWFPESDAGNAPFYPFQEAYTVGDLQSGAGPLKQTGASVTVILDGAPNRATGLWINDDNFNNSLFAADDLLLFYIHGTLLLPQDAVV